MSKTDKQPELTEEQKLAAKKAYHTGFFTEAIASGKTEKEAEELLKFAKEASEKIEGKQKKIASVILESKK